MKTTKRQHYVPQFYLRNFSNTGKNIGMFRFDNRKFIPNASVEGVAYRNFLYGEDGVFENALSKKEAKWAFAVATLLGKSNVQQLSDDDLRDIVCYLFEFIQVSTARTAKVADEYEEMYQYYEDMFQDIKDAERKLAFDEKDFFAARTTPNIMPIQIALHHVPFLFDLGVLVLINTSKRGFFTSDNPVIKYNQYYVYRSYDRDYGVSSLGLQFFLPISPEIYFCLYDRSVYSTPNNRDYICLKSIRAINQLNNLIIENSRDQFFFNSYEKEKYILKMAECKKEVSSKSVIQEYPIANSKNTLLRFGDESIKCKIKLPFFTINKKYRKIPLPEHMGGLTRPSVQEHVDNMNKELFKKDSFKITED